MTITISLVEVFDSHFYKYEKNGLVKYFPSVTTKLGIVRKPFLEEWRGNLGNRECDMRMFEAQQRGTRIHHAWYTLTTGGAVLYNNWKHPSYTSSEIEQIKTKYDGNVALLAHQDEQIDVWKLQQFMDVVKPKVVASELIVYSEQHEEAGTIDNVFQIDAGVYPISGRDPVVLSKGVYIADLKTGGTFSDDAYLQMAAYASMYEERTGEKVSGTLGLHTGASTKKGIEGFSVKFHTRAQMEEDFKTYRHVSEVWLSKNKTERPKTYEFPSLLTLKG